MTEIKCKYVDVLTDFALILEMVCLLNQNLSKFQCVLTITKNFMLNIFKKSTKLQKIS